uniref:Putative secreted protein n=1 Tax=Anopheles marajoara TaxID=58244 RepID=A0A2M4CCD3_9DIPT
MQTKRRWSRFSVVLNLFRPAARIASATSWASLHSLCVGEVSQLEDDDEAPCGRPPSPLSVATASVLLVDVPAGAKRW